MRRWTPEGGMARRVIGVELVESILGSWDSIFGSIYRSPFSRVQLSHSGR